MWSIGGGNGLIDRCRGERILMKSFRAGDTTLFYLRHPSYLILPKTFMVIIREQNKSKLLIKIGQLMTFFSVVDPELIINGESVQT